MATSKWGKYVLEAAVVAALLFGAYKYAEHQGSKNQKEKDDQASSAQIESSRKEAKDANDKVVKLANERAEAAEQRAKESQQQFSVLAQAFSALDQKSRDAHSQVDKLADSELHADIVSKLGIRKPGDSTPGYSAQEERAIDNDVTQYPIAAEKADNLGRQVEAKTKESAANKDAADARLAAFNSDESYIALLTEFYRRVYNEHPPRYRSAKCLFLWGCGKALVMPEPPRRTQ
jgi:hypothetical protein